MARAKQDGAPDISALVQGVPQVPQPQPNDVLMSPPPHYTNDILASTVKSIIDQLGYNRDDHDAFRSDLKDIKTALLNIATEINKQTARVDSIVQDTNKLRTGLATVGNIAAGASQAIADIQAMVGTKATKPSKLFLADDFASIPQRVPNTPLTQGQIAQGQPAMLQTVQQQSGAPVPERFSTYGWPLLPDGHPDWTEVRQWQHRIRNAAITQGVFAGRKYDEENEGSFNRRINNSIASALHRNKAFAAYRDDANVSGYDPYTWKDGLQALAQPYTDEQGRYFHSFFNYIHLKGAGKHVQIGQDGRWIGEPQPMASEG